MKQIMKRSLSLVLTAALLLAFLPASGSAQELTEQGQTEISALPETTDTTIAETTNKEVIAFRTENEKHYDMGGGVYQAIAYSHPVHQMDENGKWQDIDVSLSLSQTRSGSLYANKAAGVAFPSVYTPNQPIMALSGDKGSVSMALTANSPQTARAASTAIVPQVENPQNSFRTLEEANNAKFSSSIIYSDVLPGVDLEYIVDPGTVKENIIVKESADSYRYTFTLNLTGLTPVMQQDGGILLFPTGSDTPEYVIPAPYMYDALGNFSEAVTYTILGNGSTYTLTVTADESWINAKGRSFPVTIDPTITEAISLVYDTTIDSGMPDTTRATTSTLWVSAQRTPFIKCMTLSLPANATINWARLTAYYYYHDYVSSGMVNVSAHQVVSGDWNQYTLTWNGVADLPNLGLSTTTLSFVSAAAGNATINNPGRADFYITPVFQAWVNSPSINYGIALRYMASSANSSVIFHSANSTSGYNPRFEYGYTLTPDYYYTFYFDSSMTQAQLSQAQNASSVVNYAFLRQFGISFICNGSASYRSDFVDACNNAGSSCPCLEDGNDHHKDVAYTSKVLLRELNGSTNEIVVMWTNRPDGTYCNHNDIDLICSPQNSVAIVIGNRPVIHVLNLNHFTPSIPDEEIESTQNALIGITLLHETAHTFGLGEYYNIQSHSLVGMQCVMEDLGGITAEQIRRFYADISSGNCYAFCDSCEELLEDKIQ